MGIRKSVGGKPIAVQIETVKFPAFVLTLDHAARTATIQANGAKATDAEIYRAVAIVCRHVGTINTGKEFDGVYDFVLGI